jgi:hypothetical protein
MRSWRGPAAIATVLALTLGGVAGAQYQSGGGYDPSGGGGGYDPSGGGGTGTTGKVKLQLSGKKKQKSLKAVKVKAKCTGRACTVEAKGKLKAGKKKAKLKPDEESLAEGTTDSLNLKLAKKAKKTAKKAKRSDQKLAVKVTATAKGVGGGGEDKASLKIKLKP